MCDVLNQDLFSACHEYLSPTSFLQQCRSDTCKCGTPCLCSALANYARHCRRFSIIVDFRSHVPSCGEWPANCADVWLILQHALLKEKCNPFSVCAAVTCPDTMQYGTCVSSCQRRCSALSVPERCGGECEEGCVCPQGSFYNHRTHTCVHRYGGHIKSSCLDITVAYISAGSWSSGESSHFPQSDICIRSEV